MIETLLEPVRLGMLVALALLLGVSWGPGVGKARPWAFLAFNMALLATWFGGNWKGVAICLVFALVVYALLHLSRSRSHLWMFSLLALVGFLFLVKYDYPSWLPHAYRGGIWTRTMKAWLGIPDLKVTLGLSYLCFRLLHVHIEYRNGNLARVDLLPFLNYVFFVPVSLAGPINLYEPFQRDLATPPHLDGGEFYLAIRRIVLGLAKKVLIAGLISPYILGSLEPAGSHPFLLLTVASVGYSIYLYADFSGYTDIAIGLGRLFGIRLPENFDRPFLATNLQDFWARWHMTLTNWIRTYVFYPLNLFLTRQRPDHGKLLNPVLAVLVSFLLIGMWHGNQWNFVAFGLVHGIGIAFLLVLRRFRPAPREGYSGFSLWWRRAATFLFVSYSFIFFVYPLGDIPWLLGRALGPGS